MNENEHQVWKKNPNSKLKRRDEKHFTQKCINATLSGQTGNIRMLGTVMYTQSHTAELGLLPLRRRSWVRNPSLFPLHSPSLFSYQYSHRSNLGKLYLVIILSPEEKKKKKRGWKNLSFTNVIVIPRGKSRETVFGVWSLLLTPISCIWLRLQLSSLGQKVQLYVHVHKTTGLQLWSRLLEASATYTCNTQQKTAAENC